MNSHPSLYINNKWVSGSGAHFNSYNPSTGEVIWQGAAAGKADVDTAVFAARAAQESWSEMPLETRKGFLLTFKTLLTNQKDDFAKTISLENGKPLWESKNEVTAMIGKIDISIEAYALRCPEVIKNVSGSQQSLMRHRPHGVVAVFGPFNFPGHLPNGHFIPALLAGNTIIFKPSELTPLVAEKALKIWENVGLPPGVINLIQGGPETGALLAEHPEIDGLFFTGSWKTGQHLTEIFSKKTGKILALEMGGNNPLVVMDIKDLKAAAYTTIQSAYLTSGQRCSCARRLIVPKGPKGDAFVEELLSLIRTIHVGPYTETPEPFMGPLISQSAAEKLLATQEKLKQEGGISLLEMKPLKQGPNFLSPGLIDVTAVAFRQDEEYFGPLLQLIRVNSFEEALEEASRTDYGLTAGFLGDDRSQFDQFAKHIKAGIISWNSPTTNVSGALPFGGTGKSGNFRPTAYYAADYCAYPVTFVENHSLHLPDQCVPGIDTTNGASTRNEF